MLGALSAQSATDEELGEIRAALRDFEKQRRTK